MTTATKTAPAKPAPTAADAGGPATRPQAEPDVLLGAAGLGAWACVFFVPVLWMVLTSFHSRVRRGHQPAVRRSPR